MGIRLKHKRVTNYAVKLIRLKQKTEQIINQTEHQIEENNYQTEAEIAIRRSNDLIRLCRSIKVVKYKPENINIYEEEESNKSQTSTKKGNKCDMNESNSQI